MSNQPALEALNLHHAYRTDTPVLKNVSLSLQAGRVLYLLGRNGGGKSTLMHCLSGVLTPNSGWVLVAGENLHRLSPTERARRIGLIPQLHTTTFAYTVRQIVLMGRAPHLSLFGSPGAADAAIAEQSLEQVGLAHYSDRPYTQLSGGERQLVLIARGLTQQCRVLLMDEPDAHLDLNNQQRVMKIVTQLAQQGLSFVIASHVPNNALVYADEVLLLKHGVVLANGEPSRVLTEPLLTDAYDLPTEVIYAMANDERVARAILPRRL